MNFETYFKQAWSDHATQTQKVADDFARGISLVETNQQLAQIAGLITHVMGEHLGLWSDGVSLLEEAGATLIEAVTADPLRRLLLPFHGTKIASA